MSDAGAADPGASPGDVTLQTYEAAAEQYRAQTRHTPPDELADWYDQIAAVAGPGGHVLELGSGTGLGALELERRGLRVERTDATGAFVAMMRRDGHDARRLDIRSDDFGGPYDAVVADAVLLHLTRSELTTALRSAARATSANGVLAFTVKEGDGDEWHRRKLDLPRHFTYWREQPLRDHLADAGWAVSSLDHVHGRVEDWLYVIARPAGG